jgi:hypothetical protein
VVIEEFDRLKMAPNYRIRECGCETGTVDGAFHLRPCPHHDPRNDDRHVERLFDLWHRLGVDDE